LVSTPWLSVTDVLQFLLENQDQFNSGLMITREKFPFIPSCIHKEPFELYPILLLLKSLVFTVESQSCRLSTLVPPVREFHD
jgi:hypothetical protein